MIVPSFVGALPALLQQIGDQPPPATGYFTPVLNAILRGLIALANLAGGLVIGVATVRALVVYLVTLVRNRAATMPEEAIRLALGRSLSLALEFQLAADILGTALNPSPRDIATLAAIAALRTALNYFLGRELRDAQSRDALVVPHAAETPPPPTA